ncbi:MAG TPA: glycosyl hydrolase [Bryobacteraceae bacterium]|nr:glycosyl hydrolase [Bryobacteraceae bacterium]
MRTFRLAPLCIAPLAALLLLRAASPANIADALRGFQNPPDDARPMMRWWWFGPAVEKPELQRELEAMKAGGIGGVEIQPVYPVALDDPARGIRNFQYLSPEFLDDVRFAADKARDLGMRVDITLGSGWPYGGPHTTIDLAAGRLRVERIPIPANASSVAAPTLRDGEKLIAAFLARGDARQFSPDGIARLEITGLAFGPPPAAPGRVVLFFISSRTRMAVKRAAIGAEGFVLDHYSRAAIDAHLKNVGDLLLSAFGKSPPYAVFSDSLEVNSSDWTPDFLAEFQRRRGYDLAPYLPALAGDIGENTAAVRHDWGLTLTELANDNYLAPVREWAHAHGALFRSQTYGTPPVTLSSNALVDLPEGEGWDWRTCSPARWAASANHLYGRAVTSSETWTWLHSPVFRATPLDMKAEADLHFLQGVNQIVGHGWPYSPPHAEEPGWHFYAAAVFSEHNPWWLVMPDITRYLQRVSYLLRQGDPVADVALYLPTADAYARFTLGHASVTGEMPALLGQRIIPQILDSGYNFDFIDDEAIAKLGVRYPVLILPAVERIPLATYRRIEEYAGHGGVVIATGRTPSLAPGLADTAEAPAIREISRTLFAKRAKVIPSESGLPGALHAALAPDVTKPPEVGFVHRRIGAAGDSRGGDIYFLVNTSNHPVQATARFRVSESRAPAWIDVADGRMTGFPRLPPSAAQSGIQLDLAPYESRVLLFLEGRRTGRASAPPDTPPAREPIALDSGWRLTFPGAAPPIGLRRLVSWTELEGRNYYSGLATYEKTVSIPNTLAGLHAYLDFGEGAPAAAEGRRSGSGMRAMLESPVREAAVVQINGRRAGSVWHPPYRLEIGAFVHPGDNFLRITVANLAINQLARQSPPNYLSLIQKYGNRFQDQDMDALQPLPSGLLGPVRLVFSNADPYGP